MSTVQFEEPCEAAISAKLGPFTRKRGRELLDTLPYMEANEHGMAANQDVASAEHPDEVQEIGSLLAGDLECYVTMLSTASR
jgi:hypothetical protein